VSEQIRVLPPGALSAVHSLTLMATGYGLRNKQLFVVDLPEAIPVIVLAQIEIRISGNDGAFEGPRVTLSDQPCSDGILEDVSGVRFESIPSPLGVPQDVVVGLGLELVSVSGEGRLQLFPPKGNREGLIALLFIMSDEKKVEMIRHQAVAG
jgi:hypothetical protein